MLLTAALLQLDKRDLQERFVWFQRARRPADYACPAGACAAHYALTGVSRSRTEPAAVGPLGAGRRVRVVEA